jgi:hypothetical protein
MIFLLLVSLLLQELGIRLKYHQLVVQMHGSHDQSKVKSINVVIAPSSYKTAPAPYLSVNSSATIPLYPRTENPQVIVTMSEFPTAFRAAQVLGLTGAAWLSGHPSPSTSHK